MSNEALNTELMSEIDDLFGEAGDADSDELSEDFRATLDNVGSSISTLGGLSSGLPDSVSVPMVGDVPLPTGSELVEDTVKGGTAVSGAATGVKLGGALGGPVGAAVGGIAGATVGNLAGDKLFAGVEELVNSGEPPTNPAFAEALNVQPNASVPFVGPVFEELASVIATGKLPSATLSADDLRSAFSEGVIEVAFDRLFGLGKSATEAIQTGLKNFSRTRLAKFGINPEKAIKINPQLAEFLNDLTPAESARLSDLPELWTQALRLNRGDLDDASKVSALTAFQELRNTLYLKDVASIKQFDRKIRKSLGETKVASEGILGARAAKKNPGELGEQIGAIAGGLTSIERRLIKEQRLEPLSFRDIESALEMATDDAINIGTIGTGERTELGAMLEAAKSDLKTDLAGGRGFQNAFNQKTKQLATLDSRLRTVQRRLDTLAKEGEFKKFGKEFRKLDQERDKLLGQRGDVDGDLAILRNKRDNPDISLATLNGLLSAFARDVGDAFGKKSRDRNTPQLFSSRAWAQLKSLQQERVERMAQLDEGASSLGRQLGDSNWEFYLLNRLRKPVAQASTIQQRMVEPGRSALTTRFSDAGHVSVFGRVEKIFEKLALTPGTTSDVKFIQSQIADQRLFGDLSALADTGRSPILSDRVPVIGANVVHGLGKVGLGAQDVARPMLRGQGEEIARSAEAIQKNANSILEFISGTLSPEEAQAVIPQLEQVLKTGDGEEVEAFMGGVTQAFPEVGELFEPSKSGSAEEFGGKVRSPRAKALMAERIQRQRQAGKISLLEAAKAISDLQETGSVRRVPKKSQKPSRTFRPQPILEMDT